MSVKVELIGGPLDGCEVEPIEVTDEYAVVHRKVYGEVVQSIGFHESATAEAKQRAFRNKFPRGGAWVHGSITSKGDTV